jgi:putative transposase
MGGYCEASGKLARQGESKIVEGHLCPDHIHMLIEISPTYAESGVVGYIKGTTSAIARTYLGKGQNCTGKICGQAGIMFRP